MPRPRLRRKICHSPVVYFFKPQGIPLRNLEFIELTKEELESIKLKDFDSLDQKNSAKKMNTSQSSFQRIITSARKKITKAIIEGRAIKIEK